MSERRLRAGVNLIPEAPVGVISDLAVEAERLGFDRCWVYDEGLATRDLYVTMTAIAQATGRRTGGRESLVPAGQLLQLGGRPVDGCPRRPS